MRDYERFYTEIEEVSADVSVLINVLRLYYDTFLYSENGGDLGSSAKFCDWMHIINCYADELMKEMEEVLKRNM